MSMGYRNIHSCRKGRGKAESRPVVHVAQGARGDKVVIMRRCH